ncbi:MAG: hypothetical protein JWM11_2629 [Planctomycetaceae bacterium]|nr:hypothetical protein [Planctomycetaceae bacterium]
MSRNVLSASVIVALVSGLALYADPKIRPDPAGPTPLVTAQNAQPGQVITNQVQAPQAAQANRQWQWKNPDHALASCVAIGNQEEIALGELGSQKAQSDDVKKFAQMLVHDHQEFLEKLKRFAPEASAAGFLNGDTREARADNAAPRNAAPRNTVQQAGATENPNQPAAIQTTAGTRPVAATGANPGFRHLQIEREVAQQCLMGAKEKLSSETGAKFDKCFVGQQIGMHMGMKAKLTVYQRHASPELAQVFAAGLQKTEEHLAKAEELMKNLDQGSASTTTTKAAKASTNDKAATKE